MVQESSRNIDELRDFLTRHGIDVENPAYEMDLLALGWRVLHEAPTMGGWWLDLEQIEDLEQVIRVGIKQHDRNLALMRALERVIEGKRAGDEVSI